MSNRVRYHVTARPSGDWEVKREGADRASRVASTKADAVRIAAELARNRGPSQVVIHKADGKIQGERTYGKDPYPPRG